MRRSPEIAAVMRRLLEAIENQDAATVRSMVPPDDHLLIVGSAAEEWTYGPNAVAFIATQVKGLSGLRYELHTLDAYEDGPIGWVAVDATAVVKETHRVPIRMIAVCRLDEGAWRVVLWHASEPRPNDPDVMGAELTETLRDLVDAVNEGAEPIVSSSEATSSTVTLMFTDVEGSTSRAYQMGDAAWTRLLGTHFGDMERSAGANDGVVVKTLGDGAMLAFDSVAGSLRSATEIQRSLEHLETSDVRVRIGVHTGDALRSGGDYVGQAVDKAARVAAAARPGQCLVTNAARAVLATSDEFTFGRAVVLELKGIPGTTTAYPLEWSA
jgi:adenylate cyclase